MSTSIGNSGKARLLLAAVAAVAAALFVRIWHDRRTGPVPTLSDIERRARDRPRDEPAQLDWANSLYGMHRIPESVAAFKTAASLDPQDPRPLNWLGIIAVERKQPLDALKYFYASLQLNPRDPDIWRYSAKLLQQRHNAPAALKAYEHITELDPQDALSWREMAMIEHGSGAPARSIAHLQRAVALDPGDPVTENVLGNAALDDGKLAIAKQAFDRSLSLQPHDREALLGSARVTLQLDPFPAGLARAGRQIDQAIADQPTARAYLARGQWNLLQRRYRPAVADLNTVLKLDRRLMMAHSFLSQAYAALGRPQLARAEAGAYAAASRANAPPVAGDPGAPKH